MSGITSLIKLKCPHCRQGNLFVDPNPYNLKNMAAMPDKCACCGQRTEIEPGFYYGAMYCSYTLCLVIFLINFFLLVILFALPGFWFLAVTILLMIGLWPFIFRYARAIYFYLFVRFDPHALTK